VEVDSAAIQQMLESRFGAAVGPAVEGPHEAYVEIDGDRIDEVADFLRSNEVLQFDCLWNLSGVDYPEAGRIQIVYELHSYGLGHDLVLKVNADREAPEVNTVEKTWPAANWLEREVYDLLGVDFAGHSDLRRILLPGDWVGHPLRKDYVEPPEYHGISTTRESPLDIEGRH
jgi:NADH-quinone oxidoreductase subunit C